MSKLKTIISASILAAGGVLPLSSPSSSIPAITPQKVITPQQPPKEKRTKQKVYHRFEEIPAISDEDASLYNKDEYTYIINADVYQKTGKIELKRVLASEVTEASALGLIYRGECGDYTPKANEDQIIRYHVDMKVIDPSGTFISPSQMNNEAVTSFARYLTANPKTRKYVLPLITFTPTPKLKTKLANEMKQQNISADKMQEFALNKLEKLYFNADGSILPMDSRKTLILNEIYCSFKFNSTAWSKVASPKMKALIQKESAQRAKGLSNEKKNYLCLTETFPSLEELRQAHEDYNLTTFPLGRIGKPKQVMQALALSMNLKDENGNLDATRIPTFAIAASISSINWQGNGCKALSQASSPQIRASFRNSWEKGVAHLKQVVKLWVTGKSRTYGVNELSKLNIITPLIIEQCEKLELAGAENLKKKYQQAVINEEAKIKETPNLTALLSQNKKQR